MELCHREGQIMRETENCANKNIAGRTLPEYYVDNAEKIKQYKADNFEHFKQYRENNSEHIKQYKKQYYVGNKDVLTQKMTQYYADHKQEVKVRLGRKIECPCGQNYTHGHQARYFRSKKHSEHMALPIV
jgi:uncharacterized protein YecA (UPF0149 family)